jgi:hypothetical protein
MKMTILYNNKEEDEEFIKSLVNGILKILQQSVIIIDASEGPLFDEEEENINETR